MLAETRGEDADDQGRHHPVDEGGDQGVVDVEEPVAQDRDGRRDRDREVDQHDAHEDRDRGAEDEVPEGAHEQGQRQPGPGQGEPTQLGSGDKGSVPVALHHRNRGGDQQPEEDWNQRDRQRRGHRMEAVHGVGGTGEQLERDGNRRKPDQGDPAGTCRRPAVREDGEQQTDGDVDPHPGHLGCLGEDCRRVRAEPIGVAEDVERRVDERLQAHQRDHRTKPVVGDVLRDHHRGHEDHRSQQRRDDHLDRCPIPWPGHVPGERAHHERCPEHRHRERDGGPGEQPRPPHESENRRAFGRAAPYQHGGQLRGSGDARTNARG